MSFPRGLPDFFKGIYLVSSTGLPIDPSTETGVLSLKSTIGGKIKITFPPSAWLSDITYSNGNIVEGRRLLQCRNLTIEEGTTVKFPSGSVILVSDTLTVNGTLTTAFSAAGGAGGAGVSGSGAGGAGGGAGGSLLIYARNVTGSGLIHVNGGDGANGGDGGAPSAFSSGNDGSSGFTGRYLSGTWGAAATGGPKGLISGTMTSVGGGAGGAGLQETVLPLLDTLWYGILNNFPIITFIGQSGGGGGSGAADNHTGAYTFTSGGGGGGGGFIQSGGAGGGVPMIRASVSDVGTGGGGGGGGGSGGILILLAKSCSLASVQAKGGNGGAGGLPSNQSLQAGGGGGGGGSGGLILAFADDLSGTTFDVTGGAGGAGGAGTPNANPGQPGGPGIMILLPLSEFFEIT